MFNNKEKEKTMNDYEEIRTEIDFNNDFHILNTAINNNNDIDENYLTEEELISLRLCSPLEY
ncbi:hypothetical protein N9W20_01525 [Candidatus Pelagibacter bacterium]|jgi:hypothetical protein|nr:hypothetical protein [Candidatus Pelagibacter bacterium]|tara:strand:+ start:418 stop:603 length:186 start_codon:yes stop_codon:yes gene_type:complete